MKILNIAKCDDARLMTIEGMFKCLREHKYSLAASSRFNFNNFTLSPHWIRGVAFEDSFGNFIAWDNLEVNNHNKDFLALVVKCQICGEEKLDTDCVGNEDSDDVCEECANRAKEKS